MGVGRIRFFSAVEGLKYHWRSDPGRPAWRVFVGRGGDIPVAVPIQQKLKRADQRANPSRRPGPECGELRHLLGRLIRDTACPPVVPDDVVHNISGRVVDAAGLLDLGFIFNDRPMPGRKPDDLAQELLVDLAQNLRPEAEKLIRAFRVVKLADDRLEGLVVERQAGGQFVGGLRPAFLRIKVEQTGVIPVVGLSRGFAGGRRQVEPFSKAWSCAVGSMPRSSADPEEDESVDSALHGEI